MPLPLEGVGGRQVLACAHLPTYSQARTWTAQGDVGAYCTAPHLFSVGGSEDGPGTCAGSVRQSCAVVIKNGLQLGSGLENGFSGEQDQGTKCCFSGSRLLCFLSPNFIHSC